jgi:hemerythrin
MTINIQWDNSYSVGNILLDRQHQMLMRLSNELEECVGIDAQEARFRFHDILHALTIYASEHFRAEEDLMRRSGYPALASHKQEHDAFEQQIADWAFAATMGGVNLLQVQRYIAQWWKTHILATDMRYKGLLESRRS